MPVEGGRCQLLVKDKGNTQQIFIFRESSAHPTLAVKEFNHPENY